MKCKDCLRFECERRGFPETECFYEEELRKQKELEEILYWEHFRAEAAKDFVSIICNHRYDVKEERYPIICKEAIALADELIRQLKEKEEK